MPLPHNLPCIYGRAPRAVYVLVLAVQTTQTPFLPFLLFLLKPAKTAKAHPAASALADTSPCGLCCTGAALAAVPVHHKPERIGHYELLPRRLGNPTTGACPCRSARTRATPTAAAPARQRASKRHAGWLSRVWAVLRGTVRRGTQPRPHTHTHAHSYQPVCIINTYYLTYPTPHTRDARLGRR